ncbi:hypothetical protein DCAR_0934625 [Daucus carota subsp. sativus]|uniref:Uncharacterized protein n=1 Tax=Daucus carota subsp. sativus TaxID=79200 RepID=A0A175YFN8_DAUCS|nr:hypothetical protein DCAR_0934625 [Daucus carota subsp. sativus]
MAEGTRFRELDTRLSTHEGKLSELHEGLTKSRTEVTQQVTDMGGKMDKRLDAIGVRMEKLDKTFLEVKQLLLGLQRAEIGSGGEGHLGSSAMVVSQFSDPHMGTSLSHSSSMTVPPVSFTPLTTSLPFPPIPTYPLHIPIPTQALFMGAQTLYTSLSSFSDPRVKSVLHECSYSQE